MFKTRLVVVEPRFKFCFGHSDIFFLLAFVIRFYCGFVYYSISPAFSIQRAYVFCAVARSGGIAIAVAQKVLVVAGDNGFDVGGAAVAYLYGVTVKDFAVFAVRGEVFRY